MDQMKLEELPFNLVDMTIEEFYAEYESIPTDQESVIDELDPNDNLEMEDEVGEQLEDSIGNIEYDSDLSDAAKKATGAQDTGSFDVNTSSHNTTNSSIVYQCENRHTTTCEVGRKEHHSLRTRQS
ncbi:hypothetical protein CBL_13819 [Carabus blaptoides fortunei]